MAGSILTNIGLSKLASATPQNQLNITQIAVGDGNGGFPTLSPTMTALTNEVWRGDASNPIKDSENANYVYFETNIPPVAGPFDIREIACFDDTGDMIAIGHTSLIQKPNPVDDANFTVAAKIFIALENASDFDLIYQNTEVTSHNSLAERDSENAHTASSISLSSGVNLESFASQYPSDVTKKIDITGNVDSKLSVDSTIAENGFIYIQSGLLNYDGLVYPSKGQYFKRLNFSTSDFVYALDEMRGQCNQFQKIWNKLQSDQTDVYVMLLGDSTGNADGEWIKKLYDYIASECNDSYTVIYRQWDFVNDNGYLDDEILKTGTGTNTLWLYNCSIPGDNYQRFLGDLQNIAFEFNDFDLIITNYGHNHGTNARYYEQYCAFSTLISSLKTFQQGAEIVITLQNPNLIELEFSAATVEAQRDVAAKYGCGIIDGYTPYAELINNIGLTNVQSDYYINGTDPIHPSEKGMNLWAGAAINAIYENKNTRWESNGFGKTETARPLSENPFFSDWIEGSDPSGWVSNSVVLTKQYEDSETGPYSLNMLAVTGTGNREIKTDLNLVASRLAQSPMTFVARVRPSAGSSTNCGRIQVKTDSQTLSSQGSSGGKGGWKWVVFTVPRQFTFELSFSVLAGDVGDTCLIDRLGVFYGDIAYDIEPDDLSPTIDEYYDSNNVTLTFNAAGDVQFQGDLNVNGTDIDYTNQQDTQSRFAITLLYLEIGESYQVSLDDNFGGLNTVIVHRDGARGTGDVIDTSPVLVNGNNTFNITATATVNSIVFQDATADDISISNVTIVKI